MRSPRVVHVLFSIMLAGVLAVSAALVSPFEETPSRSVQASDMAFTQVSAGGWHTCGLKADGTITCWGDNSHGQRTPPGGAFGQVSAGGQHTCGMKTDGTIACWGQNNYGQSTPPGGAFS